MTTGDTSVAGLPAWIGPLMCARCDRTGTLTLPGQPPDAHDVVVTCSVCGWTDGLWRAEQRTLEDAIAESYGRRRSSDATGVPERRQLGGRRLGDP